MRRTLFLFLTTALLLAFSVPFAGATRTVPVQVDGVSLDSAAYLDGGVTSVPLRALLDALGDWELHWDASTASAVGVSDTGRTLTARPGEAAVTVDGLRLETSTAVYIRSGRTYVPLRTVCEALGLAVRWDSALGGAAVSSGTGNYTTEDLYWLSRIISAESQGESLTGQIAVGDVVLNRVTSSAFPNTIHGVIFDSTDGVQFEPVSNGTVYDTPTALSVLAAKSVLAGERVIGNCLYFYAPALSQGIWIRNNRTYYTTIGCHRFYL